MYVWSLFITVEEYKLNSEKEKGTCEVQEKKSGTRFTEPYKQA